MEIFSPQGKILANVDRVLDLIDGKNPAPVLVEVDPSNICTHSCIFCISNYIHHAESRELETFDHSIMPKDIFLNLCRDLVRMKVRAVNFTGGGEPTVNPYLVDAMNILHNGGVKMGMFTNGTLLKKKKIVNDVLSNLTWIRISIDAGRKETYNTIRRTKKSINDFDVMMDNLCSLLRCKLINNYKTDIGVGFVITPDNYKEIVDFAELMRFFDVTYVQYKPEIVNREREEGIQREAEFWKDKVEPQLEIARDILGDRFQINGYKITDLVTDPLLYGRHYLKCLGSQLQPCIGADGNVYVCTNHRGYKEYSYGSLKEKSFIEIWDDIATRSQIMTQIEDVEKFSKCTKLCKANEANKQCWKIYTSLQEQSEVNLRDELKILQTYASQSLTHPEFI